MLDYPYMLLQECAGPLAYWIAAWSTVIVVLYAIFAAQALRAALRPDPLHINERLQHVLPAFLTDTRGFLLSVAVVFLFCSLCGYGLMTAGLFWAARYELVAVLLPVLAVVTTMMVLGQYASRPLDRVFGLSDEVERLEKLLETARSI